MITLLIISICFIVIELNNNNFEYFDQFFFKDNPNINIKDKSFRYESGVVGQNKARDISDMNIYHNLDNFITINVGNSSTNTKKVMLPEDNLQVDNRPYNVQDPRWRDVFNIKVKGKELSVTRKDSRGGWGQNLILLAFRKENINTIQKKKNLLNQNADVFLNQNEPIKLYYKGNKQPMLTLDEYNVTAKDIRNLKRYPYPRFKLNNKYIPSKFYTSNIVYDEMCIGNTCINGEHLKLLTGEKIFKLKNEGSNQCLNNKPTDMLLHHMDTDPGWGGHIHDDNDDSGFKAYRYLTNNSCNRNDQYFQIWGTNNIPLNIDTL